MRYLGEVTMLRYLSEVTVLRYLGEVRGTLVRLPC